MENSIVIAKFKNWNIFNKIPLFIGILWAIVDIIIVLSEEDGTFLVLLLASALFIGIAFLIKLYFSKLSLTVTDEWIFTKRWFNKKTTMPIKKVSYVNTGLFKKISIHSDGGKLVFWGCKNDDEIFAAIVSKFNN